MNNQSALRLVLKVKLIIFREVSRSVRTGSLEGQPLGNKLLPGRRIATGTAAVRGLLACLYLLFPSARRSQFVDRSLNITVEENRRR